MEQHSVPLLMVFEPLPRPWLPRMEEPRSTARGGLGQGSQHGPGSAVHWDTHMAGDGACGAGGGLATATSSLGIISAGSRLSETLDRPLLPTHSGFELRPCFGWRRARPGWRGRMGLHLQPGDGNRDQKSPFPPTRTAPPSWGSCLERGAGACIYCQEAREAAAESPP